MLYTITKRFSRKISRNFQSSEFVTELSKTVEIPDAAALVEENTKLFEQAKYLTELDIERANEEDLDVTD